MHPFVTHFVFLPPPEPPDQRPQAVAAVETRGALAPLGWAGQGRYTARSSQGRGELKRKSISEQGGEGGRLRGVLSLSDLAEASPGRGAEERLRSAPGAAFFPFPAHLCGQQRPAKLASNLNRAEGSSFPRPRGGIRRASASEPGDPASSQQALAPPGDASAPALQAPSLG